MSPASKMRFVVDNLDDDSACTADDSMLCATSLDVAAAGVEDVVAQRHERRLRLALTYLAFIVSRGPLTATRRCPSVRVLFACLEKKTVNSGHSLTVSDTSPHRTAAGYCTTLISLQYLMPTAGRTPSVATTRPSRPAGGGETPSRVLPHGIRLSRHARLQSGAKCPTGSCASGTAGQVSAGPVKDAPDVP